MTSGEWTEATKAFFQAFKAYDEAGSGLRINCLKYGDGIVSIHLDPFPHIVYSDWISLARFNIWFPKVKS